MASKSPWSVKGVSQDDRDQAKTAARRAGLPVGVWLSRQIRAGGSENEAPDVGHSVPPDGEPQRGSPSRGGPDSRFTFGPGQWSTATDAVDGGWISQPPPQPWPAARQPMMPNPPPMPSQQMAPQMPQQMHPGMHSPSQMASHWAMPALTHPMYMHQPPPQPQALQPQAPQVDAEEVKALERKIESLQKRLAAAEARSAKEADVVQGRLDKVDSLAHDVDALRNSAGQETEPNYSTAPVERAVMRLSERLQRIEDAILPEESGGGLFSKLFRRR
jgi:hypothetical protein